MKVVGVIVAGGRATRFGADKALVRVEGEALIARVAAVLAPACAGLAVSARPGSGAAAWAAQAALPVLRDPPGTEGPLAGVVAGLAWAKAEGADLLATAPCDTPWLPADLVPRLVTALQPGAAGAIAEAADGPHPLCAVWRVDRAGDLRAALEAGPRHPPLHRLAAELGCARAAFPDAAAFANVNTPADLAARPA